MSQQIFDANGNLVVQAGAVASSEQQVANAGGVIISPATEDGNLATIRAKTDSLSFLGDSLRTHPYPSLPESRILSQAGRAFAFTPQRISVGTTETDILLFRNPAGSGNIVYFDKRTFECNISGRWTRFAVYAGPTVTANGAAVAVNRLRIGGTTTSTSLVNLSPSISVRGTLICETTVWNTTSPVIILDNLGWSMLAGSTILFTAIASSGGTLTGISSSWVENTI